jgi:hypothetical protein
MSTQASKMFGNRTGKTGSPSKSLAGEVERLKSDKRLVEWNMRRKVLTADDVKKQTETLPDLSAQSEKLAVEHELGN